MPAVRKRTYPKPAPSSTDELDTLTSAEVCERLNISTRTLTRYLNEGRLRNVGPRGHGKPIKVSIASLRAYIDGGAR